MKCNHDEAEQDVALVDGMCPLCLADELLTLRERVAEQDKQLTWWLDTYDITMPCGHKNRYLLTDGRGELVKETNGDCVCVMCQLELSDKIEEILRSQ